MALSRRTILHALTAASVAGAIAIPANGSAASSTANGSGVSPPEITAPVEPSPRTSAAKDEARAAREAAQRASAAEQRARQEAEQQAEQARQRAEAERASRSRSADLLASYGSPRQLARAMLAVRGQGDQFGCLSALWERESGWSTSASNASGAYGIPQALPGSRMASAGDDWRTNPSTQIRWGLDYIEGRYGNACNAREHAIAKGWY